ncbi:MAG: hypothetical protein M5U05_18605 [Anaerolineales bacterium]|nr:hypothetical protein [Anaerolineales bacterium]
MKEEACGDPGISDEASDRFKMQHLNFLSAETGFDELEGIFDRPTTAVKAKNTQGFGGGGDRPIGQQIPGITGRAFNLDLDDPDRLGPGFITGSINADRHGRQMHRDRLAFGPALPLQAHFERGVHRRQRGQVFEGRVQVAFFPRARRCLPLDQALEVIDPADQVAVMSPDPPPHVIVIKPGIHDPRLGSGERFQTRFCRINRMLDFAVLALKARFMTAEQVMIQQSARLVLAQPQDIEAPVAVHQSAPQRFDSHQVFLTFSALSPQVHAIQNQGHFRLVRQGGCRVFPHHARHAVAIQLTALGRFPVRHPSYAFLTVLRRRHLRGKNARSPRRAGFLPR